MWHSMKQVQDVLHFEYKFTWLICNKRVVVRAKQEYIKLSRRLIGHSKPIQS